MAYCKFCGMESKTADKCEWCGRSLAMPAAKPREITPTTADIVEKAEEEERKSRVAFYISNIALLVLAAILIAVKKELYPLVIIGGLFISGVLIGYLGVIPSFEDEWLDVGIPVGLIFFLPAFVVCAGYIAYGLIYRSMDLTIVWLLGTYVVMVTALEAVTILVMIGGVPAGFILTIHGVEFLGLVAMVFGWISSGSLRLDR